MIDVFVSNRLLFRTISFQRKGKYTSIAKTHLDEVVRFFTKIDPALGNLADKSMPADNSSHSTSQKNNSIEKKRKNSNGNETQDTPPRKKSHVGNTGSLTLSQREKRAMELLASYLEECGGIEF